MTKYNPHKEDIEKVLKVLKERGPMTYREMARALDTDYNGFIRPCVNYLRGQGKIKSEPQSKDRPYPSVYNQAVHSIA